MWGREGQRTPTATTSFCPGEDMRAHKGCWAPCALYGDSGFPSVHCPSLGKPTPMWSKRHNLHKALQHCTKLSPWGRRNEKKNVSLIERTTIKEWPLQKTKVQEQRTFLTWEFFLEDSPDFCLKPSLSPKDLFQTDCFKEMLPSERKTLWNIWRGMWPSHCRISNTRIDLS